jgi:hypothetical protein
MSANTECTSTDPPSKDDLPTYRRGADTRPTDEPTRDNTVAISTDFELANSTVVLEDGPAGTIARVERDGTVDYAGPLPTETVLAIVEVAE